MFIKCVKINKRYTIFSVITCIIVLAIIFVLLSPTLSIPASSSNLIWENGINTDETKKSYIKWVNFSIPSAVLEKTARIRY